MCLQPCSCSPFINYCLQLLKRMNKINILVFGPLVDVFGKKTFEIDRLATTDALKAKLETDFPDLKDRHYAIAVDMQFITTETSLEGVETVALLPPYSGG